MSLFKWPFKRDIHFQSVFKYEKKRIFVKGEKNFSTKSVLKFHENEQKKGDFENSKGIIRDFNTKSVAA